MTLSWRCLAIRASVAIRARVNIAFRSDSEAGFWPGTSFEVLQISTAQTATKVRLTGPGAPEHPNPGEATAS